MVHETIPQLEDPRSRQRLGVGVRLTRTCAAVMLAAMVLPVASLAQERRVYQDAVEALQQKKTEQAIAGFREAIGLDREERKRIGPFSSDPYVPHYYLGEALFQLGDCAGAMRSWDESLSQGVVQELPQNLDLHRSKAVCQNRREVRAQASEADAALTGAAAKVEEVREGIGNPELAEFLEGFDVGGRLAAVEQQLAKARRDLASAVEAESLESVKAAAQAARTAESSLAGINREAEGRLEQRRVEIGARISSLVNAAGSALRSTEFLDPYPSEVARLRQMLGSLITAAGRRDELALGDLVRLAGQLQSVRRRLDVAATPPPDSLMQAAEAFLAGDYSGTVETLAAADLDGRAAVHAHMLRAAALFSMAGSVTDGDALLEEAKAAVRSCNAADDSFVPSEELYSPRFVAFFAEALQPEEEPAAEGEAIDGESSTSADEAAPVAAAEF